jgi:hypothetical protein
MDEGDNDIETPGDGGGRRTRGQIVTKSAQPDDAL